MQFGRGGERFICYTCGDFFNWIDGCAKCKSTRFRAYMAHKKDFNKKMGIVTKTATKRAGKAYMTRLVNIGMNDPDRFRRLIDKLEKRDGDKRRVNMIKKRINEST